MGHSRHQSESNLSNEIAQQYDARQPEDGIDEEAEKAFLLKYFSKKERIDSLTPQILKQNQLKYISVAEAKERLKKVPYSAAIKHLR